MTRRVVGMSAGLTLALATAAHAQRTCESLKDLSLNQASITSAATVPAGPFKTPPGPGALPVPPLTLPAYCRVQGVARPTSDSEIKFEVWLPDAASWNGRFEQIGNGGFAGTINPGVLAGGVARGFATAATDDGHVGGTSSFAVGHPEKVIDFGHRAVHETAVHAKAIVAALYGKPPAYSYFAGCSDGGREALMEAQRYPADFNGIMAGAPASNWTPLLTSAVWNYQALTAEPGSAIPDTKLLAIQNAVVAACDQLDGVRDGLIEDPRRCRFEPSKLKCKGADGPGCLTPGQVAALEKLYRGPKHPKTGAPIFSPVVPGTEALSGTWVPWLVGPSPTGLPLQAWFGTSFYRDMVFENAKWDYKTMDFDRDFALALRKAGTALDANDPDLRPFRDRGGKLVQYHGWGDAAIPAGSSIEYYERVKRTVEPGSGKPVEDFYRLFMVPGMSHCAGGLGPNDFGNLAIAGTTRGDADHDLHLALERWVEQGTPPDRIIAAGVRPGDPADDPTKATKISRLLCAYPRVEKHRGSGSTDDAANFACTAGKPAQ